MVLSCIAACAAHATPARSTFRERLPLGRALLAFRRALAGIGRDRQATANRRTIFYTDRVIPTGRHIVT